MTKDRRVTICAYSPRGTRARINAYASTNGTMILDSEFGDMADFCVDCAAVVYGTTKGQHDLASYTAWQLCEGCGAHIFVNGIRLCERGPWASERATMALCAQCEDVWRTVKIDEDV